MRLRAIKTHHHSAQIKKKEPSRSFYPTSKHQPNSDRFMTQQIDNNINNNINNAVVNNSQSQRNRYALPFQVSQQGNRIPTAAPTTTATATPPPMIQGKHNLPAFLNKLYGMVNSPETDPWVFWNAEGSTFIIPNSQTLAEHVLGRHFKHNNFASFVRQLNMYGFHKVPHLNHGVLDNDGLPEVWEFSNTYFSRDRPETMRYIIRKKGEAEKARSAAKQARQSASPQPHCGDPADVAIVRAEMQTLAGRQNIIKSELGRLAASTDGLWKYALETRQLYQEQQDKIDKLIKVLSEAFFKQRVNSTELPNKVRGLIESASPFEELSENTPSVQTPMTQEQTQWDLMKLLASGKVPVGLQEIIQQYFQNQNFGTVYPSAPVSPTMSPTIDTANDALMRTASNAQQLGQVQDWFDHADQGIHGLGIDLNPPVNPPIDPSYGDFLADSHFPFDPYPFTTPDPAMDNMFSQYVDTQQTQDGNPAAGQKRAFEDQEEEVLFEKRRRI
jgi:HSF-type DNA-binding